MKFRSINEQTSAISGRRHQSAATASKAATVHGRHSFWSDRRRRRINRYSSHCRGSQRESSCSTGWICRLRAANRCHPSHVPARRPCRRNAERSRAPSQAEKDRREENDATTEAHNETRASGERLGRRKAIHGEHSAQAQALTNGGNTRHSGLAGLAHHDRPRDLVWARARLAFDSVPRRI